MKILDSTILIAFLGDIECPKLIDKMLELKHDLMIPHSVYLEINTGSSSKTCKKLIEEKKLSLLRINKNEEIEDFKKTYPYLGSGEIDTILSFKKLYKKDEHIYCILDDKLARRTAELLKIVFTGTLGLLKVMKKRVILSTKEYDDIINELKKSGFRLPKEIC